LNGALRHVARRKAQSSIAFQQALHDGPRNIARIVVAPEPPAIATTITHFALEALVTPAYMCCKYSSPAIRRGSSNSETKAQRCSPASHHSLKTLPDGDQLF
jgi:hypothetical protein